MRQDKSESLRLALRLFAPRLLQSENLQREYRFAAPRLWRFDWAWVRPMAPLAVEIDGGRYAPGGGRHAGDGDREKLNVATVLGWRVLRFSTQQVEREPERVVEVIVLAYDGETRLPGWLGGSRR